MMNGHILLVENEVKLAQFIELELKYENYQVTVAPNGISGLKAAQELNPDLVILDSMLSGLSGLELCRILRTNGNMVPVILLTPKDDVPARVAGLDAGADDYILKPVSTEELLDRIRTYLRRTQEDDPDRLTFADLNLNQRTREVFRGGRLIELTAKEFDLLEYLISHPREVLSREQILANVWGYDFMGDSNIIEVYIRYLRLKLEAKNEKRLIQTVRGIGYVLRD
ncbi:response regulator transcription factor [Planktothricoides sp. FACHB-1370]|uniref:Response regulator transcription factor n=2 Tax=Planktothricoides raciborskii TaxID=132608 RepID=A0ABR8EE04_9CYAN|nr:response regulator transcription factor [Planktothricoides raciborskii FACHB-1370]MBD2582979.1 response regulator transcription factor [Planktothricoides raciborskii FACHB-1261]